MEWPGKKNLRGGIPSKILVAHFSWLNRSIKKNSVGEPLAKLQLLSLLGLPKKAKSGMIDKVWVFAINLEKLQLLSSLGFPKEPKSGIIDEVWVCAMQNFRRGIFHCD